MIESYHVDIRNGVKMKTINKKLSKSFHQVATKNKYKTITIWYSSFIQISIVLNTR
jgi:hypothetical protein